MLPILTIITVCYNSDKTILETLNSVLELKNRNNKVEFIVKDGASKDNTLEILESYRSIIDKFYTHKDNGIYDAMNFASDKASGLYTIFINSDDFVNPDQMDKTIDILSKINKDMIASSVLISNSQGMIVGKRYANLKPLSFSHTGMPCSHQGLFLKTSLLKALKFNLDFNIAADYELILRSISNGASYKNIDLDCSTYRLGGTSYGNVAKKENFKIQQKYLGKVCAVKNFLKEMFSITIQRILPNKLIILIKKVKSSDYDYIQKN